MEVLQVAVLINLLLLLFFITTVKTAAINLDLENALGRFLKSDDFERGTKTCVSVYDYNADKDTVMTVLKTGSADSLQTSNKVKCWLMCLLDYYGVIKRQATLDILPKGIDILQKYLKNYSRTRLSQTVVMECRQQVLAEAETDFCESGFQIVRCLIKNLKATSASIEPTGRKDSSLKSSSLRLRINQISNDAPPQGQSYSNHHQEDTPDPFEETEDSLFFWHRSHAI